MNHEQKKKLARKMRTPQELTSNVGLFLTKAWERRKIARWDAEREKQRKAAQKRGDKQ